MTHHPSLDSDPIGRAKLTQRLDVLLIVVAFASLALVLWGETPRMVNRGITFVFICVMVARLVIQGRRPDPVHVTGLRASVYLITGAACAVAAVWIFPADSLFYKLLLLAVIPLTLGVGEFFRWRARSATP